MIDCNVKFKQNKREHMDVAKNMLALGWDAAVWNNVIVGKLTSQNHKLMQNSSCQQVVLEPVEVKECVRLRKIVANDSIDSIKHYNRLTSIIDDVMDIQLNSNNPSSKLYDVIAICPGNQQVFSHLCKSAPIDLISIDFTHRVPFPMNKALLDEAVARGVLFEIVYTPMLTNAALRRDVMSGTRVLVQFLRGRNIVLSSGVEHCQDVRGPFDAINIGQLLGMSQQQAKDAVCKNAQSLIQHGAARKLKYIPVEVLPVQELTRRWPNGGKMTTRFKHRDDRALLDTSVSGVECPIDTVPSKHRKISHESARGSSIDLAWQEAGCETEPTDASVMSLPTHADPEEDTGEDYMRL